MKRNNIILLAFLAVLIIVFFLSKCKDNIEKRQDMFSMKVADIQKFDISSATDTLHVALVDNVWTVTHPRTTPAKETQIQKFFDEFLKLTVSTLSVTDNPEKQAFYNVDDATATIVTIYGKNDRILSRVYVGNSTNNPQYSYIRVDKDNQIYQIDNVRTMLNPTLSTWREDRVITLQPEAIFSVTLARESDSFSLSQEGGFWNVVAGDVTEPIDPTNEGLSRYLSTLTTLRTSTVYYDSYDQYSDKLATPTLALHIVSTTQQSTFLTIAQNDANSYIAQKGDDTSILYRLSTAQFNQLNTPSAGFYGQ